MGLSNLRARVEALGGVLQVESTPGERDDGSGDVPVLTGPGGVRTFDPCVESRDGASLPHVREVFRRGPPVP